MKQPIEITLNLSDYLDKAFKTIPSNANIHKGRCGIGGTTIEIEADRPSIIPVPTNGIITDKCKAHPELFPVQGGVTVKQIETYLASNVKNKKIMTTPDSFENIITAAKNIRMLDELCRDFFMLMDESHSAVTESFRQKMLVPFKYFWKFTNKSLISATPFEFSDKRFQELTPYRIKFHERHLGKIVVRDTPNIAGCVDWYIKNRHLFGGKLFFFYNSVTEAAEVIKRNKLTSKEAHIYCADKADNFIKLSEDLAVFQQEPNTGQYAEVNFFTTKYFEGFDLKEKDATIILVTDVTKPHTKVGITNKGVQAIGRVRYPAKSLIHITNNRNKEGMKTLAEFKAEYEIHTDNLISSYNTYVNNCTKANIQPLESVVEPLKRFAEVDDKSKLATLNETLLDQVLNELVCNEQFNNSETIIQAWSDALYEVEQEPFVEPILNRKRMSKANKLKVLVDMIETIQQNKDQYVMGNGTKELSLVQKNHPLAFEAYHVLGKEKLAELKYKENAISEALIEQHNESAEPKLLLYLDTKVRLGERYPRTKLASILQYAYNLHQIKDPKTGKVSVATATQFGDAGRFGLKECKIEDNGKIVNGFEIAHKYFSLPIAA